MATAGFILGLLGLLGSWIPVVNVFAAILGVAGLILAAIGLSKSKRVNAGKGLAIAGIVLGILAVFLTILVNTAFVKAVDKAVDDITKSSVKGSTDPNLGTTRQNPAPLGSTIVSKGWEVKINSVKAVEHDKDGNTPDAGKVFLIVNVTETYTGNDKDGDTTWSSVDYVTASGETIDDICFCSVDDELDVLKTLYKGGSTRGNEMMEVPAHWQGGVLAVQPDLGNDKIFVAVK